MTISSALYHLSLPPLFFEALCKSKERRCTFRNSLELSPERVLHYGGGQEGPGRRIKEDGDERGMLIYGYKFRPVLG